MWKLILISSLFVAACSSHNNKAEIKEFVSKVKEQSGTGDKKYFNLYQDYLFTVERVYRNNGASKKFQSYLDSLENNTEILLSQEEALPQLYKQRTGKDPITSNEADYELFKTREMTDLYDKLFTARELKIKDEVGEEAFSDLRENYEKFVKNEKAKPYGFPL